MIKCEHEYYVWRTRPKRRAKYGKILFLETEEHCTKCGHVKKRKWYNKKEKRNTT